MIIVSGFVSRKLKGEQIVFHGALSTTKLWLSRLEGESGPQGEEQGSEPEPNSGAKLKESLYTRN